MNSENTFANLTRQGVALSTVASAAIVECFRNAIPNDEVKIGALKSLGGFTREVVHVVILVKETGKNRSEEVTGRCSYLLIFDDGSVSIQLDRSLDAFWPIRLRKERVQFSEIPKTLHEVLYFLEHGKRESQTPYRVRDGLKNQRLHRALRAMEKCAELKAVFGYKITAWD